MHRFYVMSAPNGEGYYPLTPEDAHHALRVLRLGEGDTVELVADGERFTAAIARITRGEVWLARERSLPGTEPSFPITLFQGLPKADKMDLVVRKAVELGVSRIVPVKMSRCVVRLTDSDARKKQERWQRIAREAGKQSGRCLVPEVTLPTALSQLPELPDFPGLLAVPWEECEAFGPLAFSRAYPEPPSLGIVIGPEGGMEKEEVSFLKQHGGIPMTLGKRVLRTETAGLAAVSAFLGLYGEME